MNEEQLADLLTEHLDSLLTGAPMPETLPIEVAELLTVAQSLSETTPIPHPEFGPALKESLLGPIDGNGTAPSTGSAFNSQLLTIIVVGLLVSAVVVAVLVSVVISGVANSTPAELPSPSPSVPTPTTPFQFPSPSPAFEATVVAPTTQRVAQPTLTATPIIDVFPAITITVEIRIEPPHLVPGSGGGSNSDNNDSGDGSGGGGNSGDHDRGHGNDPDHDDEDNPGKSHDD